MSTHPNAMLLCILTPDDLARKTARSIADGIEPVEGDWEIKIGRRRYTMQVMESDYDEDDQVKAPEGSIVVRDYLTYGYGEVIDMVDVEMVAGELRAWADDICRKHHCTYEIKIGANYW